MGYGLHSEFDIKKHKETFVHYLEVVIDQDGHISYAVPSHQERMIRAACECRGLSRQGLNELCPKEYLWDYLKWLSKMSGMMVVWEDSYEVHTPTRKQVAALRRLKLAGLYLGTLPKIDEEVFV